MDFTFEYVFNRTCMTEVLQYYGIWFCQHLVEYYWYIFIYDSESLLNSTTGDSASFRLQVRCAIFCFPSRDLLLMLLAGLI